MKRLLLTATAKREMRRVRQESEERFGARTADAYADLLQTALRDLQIDCERSGVKPAAHALPGIRLYHLRHSRQRVSSAVRIAAPRHLIAFRIVGETIEVLRVLHDAMDIAARLGDED